MKNRFAGITCLKLLGLAAAFALFAGVGSVTAQDVFFTQSGGRGLQNAKTNARLSKTENDVSVLQDEMAEVKPHAKAPITSCADPGAKLRWTGNSWSCDNETDPTVQDFAKKPLPICGSGEILSVVGSDFGCADAGFVATEVDPTVQDFAKNPLPNCGTGEVLTADFSGELKCAADDRGLTKEEDPLVYEFARIDQATINNCPTGQVLSMLGDRLTCVFDAVGITVEEDPLVQDFARTDVVGATLNACAANEILVAVDNGGSTVLQCQAGSTAIGGVIADIELDDLKDVNADGATGDEVLRFDGSNWVNSSDKIGGLTSNRWCYFDASNIVCDRNIPAPMPGSTCTADEVITWNGSAWSCVDAADVVGSALALDDLNDVSITTPAAPQVLVYDGSGWVNAYTDRILTGNTYVRVTDGGSGYAQMVVDNAALLTAINNRIGIKNNDPGADLDVAGTISATNLLVTGYMSGQVLQTSSYVSAGSIHTSGTVRVSNTLYANELRSISDTYVGQDLYVVGDFYVSGSQSIDGVIFANGGVSATGAISATNFYGDGSGLTNLSLGSFTMGDGVSGSVVYRGDDGKLTSSDKLVWSVGDETLRVSQTLLADTLQSVGDGYIGNDLYVSGSLFVSGSQSIDGVIFANGGISATGAISATNFYGDGSGLTNVTASNMSWYGLTDIPTGVQNISNTALDTDELTQLQAINAVTINNTQWGYLGALNQGLATTDNVVFNQISTTSDVRVGNDLYVTGDFYVSGSQTIDGVIFANGGISATGAISATNFYGDGSGLTNVTAENMDWYGLVNIPTGVQNISNTALDTAELTQLQAINAVTVSTTQWGYLGAMNQGVATGDTVTFANLNSNGYVNTGLLQASGYISAGSVHTSGTVRISNTLYTDVMRSIGDTYVGNDLYVAGDLYVSGSQSIDGVLFANGGITATRMDVADISASANVSVTGNVSANKFIGDGSELSNITADYMDWYGLQDIPTGVQNISNTALDTDELTQLQAINAVTINNTQWGYLGALNQGLATTDNVVFNQISTTSDVRVGNDLYVTGDFYVSGTQVFDGVTFANGGISASGVISATGGLVASNISVTGHVSVTGNVSANKFIGDGSELTGIDAGSVAAAGNPGEIQLKANDGNFGTSSTLVWETVNPAAPKLYVSGTVQMAGTGGESCGSGTYGMLRINPSTGALQLCRE